MLQSFIAGFFIFNSLPHLVKGITGQTHMTPFKRVSSPIVNVVWGFFNLVAGVYVLNMGSVEFVLTPKGENLWYFLLGGFALALVAAWLFGNKKARFPWQKK